MRVYEALELMKNGAKVVAFQPDAAMAQEMFHLTSPDTIEIFLPTLSDQPADVLSPEMFLASYKNHKFVGYNT